LFTRKLKHGKPSGAPILSGYELEFNTPLVAGSAMNLGNYQIGTTKTKKVHKKPTTVFTPISGVSVSYAASSDSVSLTFAAKETFSTGGRLTVLPGIESASGGTMSSSAVFTISTGGKSINPS
jgi:hypothetical protein